MELDDKLQYSERPLGKEEMEFLNESEIRIDNGSDEILVDLDEIRHNIEHLMDEGGVLKVINRIQDFAEKVRIEKEKGVHLGSSDLADAVAGEILIMDPKELDLERKEDLAPLYDIVKGSCKRDVLEFRN